MKMTLRDNIREEEEEEVFEQEEEEEVYRKEGDFADISLPHADQSASHTFTRDSELSANQRAEFQTDTHSQTRP